MNVKKWIEILTLSLKKGYDWSVWKFLFSGGVGSLFGTLLFGNNFFEMEIEQSVIYGVSVMVFLYLVRVILIFFSESFKYFHEVYKNSIYGDAILLLKDAFAALHSYRKVAGHQDEAFMAAMVTMCNNLKKIYDNITKSNCCVSIKVPFSDSVVNEKTVLSNLVRDTIHSKPDTQLNRETYKYRGIKHTLVGNTAFINAFNKVLKNQKKRYYLNNMVNRTDNYDNTSKECYENGILPYKSELVHPIVPIQTDTTKLYCSGFICVDSDKEDAFKSEYDYGLLEGVADGIYDVITERNNNIKRK